MSAIIIGATGLVGSSFLKLAESSAAISSITTISRRQIEGSEKLNSVVKASIEEWPAAVESVDGASIFFSGFGTTRADAGSLEAFKRIDYGTNIECARAAKKAQVKTYILVSSAGSNSSSYFPYLKTKGELEDDVLALGFDRTVILRPGPLLGHRVNSHKGFGNSLGAKVAEWARGTPFDSFIRGVFDEELAKASMVLASKPHTAEKEVHVLEALQIVSLAKEWKD